MGFGIGEAARGAGGPRTSAGGGVKWRSRLLVTLPILSFLASTLLAEERENPSIGRLLERIKEAVGADGHIDFSKFGCEPPDPNAILDCYDDQSGVGFQYRAETFGEALNVNIVLHEIDAGIPTRPAYEDHLAIFDEMDFVRQSLEFSALKDDIGASASGECNMEFNAPDQSGVEAEYFTWTNPVSETLMLIIFNGVTSNISQGRGRLIPEQDGFLVGSIVIVNNMDLTCITNS